MTKGQFDVIESHMLECMMDAAHDAQHIYRVLTQAMKLAQHYAVDKDVLITACLLHDIGREQQFRNPLVCHAMLGGDMAEEFLTGQGWNRCKVEAVKHCIQTHRFRSDMQPETIEARILFDADKLDVTGAFGIARTLMYSGTTGRPVYTVDDDGRVQQGRPEEPDSFFREYHRKLKRIYDVFYTEEARRIGEERRLTAQGFYQSLADEIGSINYKKYCYGEQGGL